MNREVDERTRRGLLVTAAAGTATLAGCISGDSSDDTDDGGDTNSSNSDNPDEATAETTASSVPVRGDPDAEVVLEVFEDLGCPACRSYVENGLPELESQYIETERIRYEHRDFPVTGVEAEQAASAAREVLNRHGNGAFWEFVSAVFSNQDRLVEAPALFGELAANLGFDADAVETAGAERTHQSVVDRDLDRGQSLGVDATPSFAVDGELVDTGSARSIGDIVDVVSDSLNNALDEDSGDDTPY